MRVKSVEKVRVGIVGLGNWGKCHLEAYLSLPHVEVVALCDANEKRLKAIANEYRIADAYSDDRELWERNDIDLVSVVTFEENHFQPVESALTSGKHVIVEKPVSLDAREARQMWELAQQHDRTIVPGHLLRFEPRYAHIQHTLRTGHIGDPVSMHLKRARPKSLFTIYKRTHTVYELTVHDLDLAIWYADSRVKKVKAYERSVTGANVPDILWACLEFENGVLAVLESNWLTPDEARMEMRDFAEVIGEAGVANLDTSHTGLRMWDGKGMYVPELNVHNQLYGTVVGALREELCYVCDCILRKQEPVHLSFTDAIHGVEVAEAIIESSRTGREISLD